MPAPRPGALRQLVGPIAGSVLGLIILALSLQIRDTGSGIYGPRFWPQLIGVLLLLINASMVLRALIARSLHIGETAAETSVFPLREAGLRHWLTVLLVLGLPLVVDVFGFLLGSAIFLLVFMVALGYRRWAVVLPTALVFSLALTWFFTAGVFTPLPPGKGIFYAMSTEFARIVSGKRG